MRIPSLNFICPICGAQPGEQCELTTGTPRFESHSERVWIAQDHRLRPGITEPPQGWQEEDRIGRTDHIEDALSLPKAS